MTPEEYTSVMMVLGLTAFERRMHDWAGEDYPEDQPSTLDEMALELIKEWGIDFYIEPGDSPVRALLEYGDNLETMDNAVKEYHRRGWGEFGD